MEFHRGQSLVLYSFIAYVIFGRITDHFKNVPYHLHAGINSGLLEMSYG